MLCLIPGPSYVVLRARDRYDYRDRSRSRSYRRSYAQNGVPRSGITKRRGLFSGWGYGCVGFLGTFLYGNIMVISRGKPYEF